MSFLYGYDRYRCGSAGPTTCRRDEVGSPARFGRFEWWGMRGAHHQPMSLRARFATASTAVYVEAACRYAISRSGAYDSADSAISFAIGPAIDSGPEYASGYRGPATTEGRLVIDALRAAVWVSPDAGNGPHDRSARTHRYRGWEVVARLGVPVGVMQVWSGSSESRGADKHELNLWIPRLLEWHANPVLRRFDVEQAVAAFEVFDTLLRVDGSPRDIAMEACTRL